MDIVKRQQLGIVSLIVFSVVVVVGIIVYSSINTSVSAVSTSSAAQNVISNVSSNTFNAFNLVAVGPIIFGAVIILGIVGLLYMRQ